MTGKNPRKAMLVELKRNLVEPMIKFRREKNSVTFSRTKYTKLDYSS